MNTTIAGIIVLAIIVAVDLIAYATTGHYAMIVFRWSDPRVASKSPHKIVSGTFAFKSQRRSPLGFDELMPRCVPVGTDVRELWKFLSKNCLNFFEGVDFDSGVVFISAFWFENLYPQCLQTFASGCIFSKQSGHLVTFNPTDRQPRNASSIETRAPIAGSYRTPIK